MAKIQQETKKEAPAVKQEDDFLDAMGEALDIFASMPDVSDDSASWNMYELDDTYLHPIEPLAVKTEPEAAETGNGLLEPPVETDDVGEQMLEDVARYLLEDKSFRRSVEELASQSQKGIRSYPQFLQRAKGNFPLSVTSCFHG